MEDESGNPRNCSKKPCPNDLNKFNSLFCRTKIKWHYLLFCGTKFNNNVQHFGVQKFNNINNTTYFLVY